jgi:hypothetical protein
VLLSDEELARTLPRTEAPIVSLNSDCPIISREDSSNPVESAYKVSRVLQLEHKLHVPALRQAFNRIALIALFLALAFGTARTKSPWSDEGWFASPALNLERKGFLGTTVLEPTGGWFKGDFSMCLDHIDRRTYWVMPLDLLAQAGFYKLAGFGLLRMRALSIVWALVALMAWFLIVRALSGNPAVAWLAATLLAFDHVFMWLAADGRMDMMAAALGSLALALYLILRSLSLPLALLAGTSLAAAAVFTHPNAILASANLFILAMYFDYRQFRPRHLAIALAPYLVFAAGWGAYALEDRPAFLCQFVANAAGRKADLSSPLAALWREISERYLVFYGMDAASRAFSRARLLIPLAYVVSVIGICLRRDLRLQPMARVLLPLLGLDFLFFTLFEDLKLFFYLVHMIPLYTALLALWIHSLWTNSTFPRPVVALGISMLLLIQIGIVGHRIFVLDTYHKRYLPMIGVLKQHSGPSTLIMGSAELAFEMGFDRVLDDARLGYGSGKTPGLIVIDERYESSFADFRLYRPEIYRHIQKRLGQYKVIYHDSLYTVYAADGQ